MLYIYDITFTDPIQFEYSFIHCSLTYLFFRVIWATFKFGIFVNGPYPANFIMVGFLLVLQILHIYWFCLIMKIAIQVKSNGRVSSICYFSSLIQLYNY